MLKLFNTIKEKKEIRQPLFIEITCLGGNTEDKKKFLKKISRIKDCGNFNNKYPLKFKFINVVEFSQSSSTNLLFGLHFVLIFPENVNDLQTHINNIQHTPIDRQNTPIICCSNDITIIRKAYKLQLDYFLINHKGVSEFQCELIKQKITTKFNKFIQNEIIFGTIKNLMEDNYYKCLRM